MAIEIERKFLVKTIPENQIQYSHHIKQGYIVSDKDKVIRVRQKENDYFITIKGNKVGISRFEFEYPIPKPDAKKLFKHFCGKKLIEKIRHYIEYEGCTWEVDVFCGENAGLVIAEIELESENQEFHLPNWVGSEVTYQEKYYNMNLIKRSFNKWSED
tara:strand:+ start:76 stop:549 length:474 start_codon:yes stop_codon:yes gene_type:complete